MQMHLDSLFWIPLSGFPVLVFVVCIHSSGFRSLNFGIWLPISRLWVSGSEFCIPQSRLCVPISSFRCVVSEFWVLYLSLWLPPLESYSASGFRLLDSQFQSPPLDSNCWIISDSEFQVLYFRLKANYVWCIPHSEFSFQCS